MPEPDDLDVQEQGALGRQFDEPISTPHPGLLAGFESYPLYNKPVLAGAAQAALYGTAAIAHAVTGMQPGDYGGGGGRMYGGGTALGRMYGVPQLAPDERTDKEKESGLEALARNTAKSIAADPKTTGGIYQTVQGLSEFATKLSMGAPAGPVGILASTFGTTAYEQFHNYKDQGLDDATAEKLATADASITSAFALSGGLGSMAKTASITRKLMAEAAAGVGTNVTLGFGQRALDHTILENAGYHDLADQQQVWDGQSIFMDMAMGVIPVAHTALSEGFLKAAAAGRQMYQADGALRDAVAVAKQREAMSDLAAGVATDSKSATFHDIALRVANEKHLAGKPVDFSDVPMPDGATFAPRPRPESEAQEGMQMFADHLHELGYSEALGTLDDDTRALIERVTGEKMPKPERAANEPEAPAPEPESLAELAERAGPSIVGLLNEESDAGRASLARTRTNSKPVKFKNDADGVPIFPSEKALPKWQKGSPGFSFREFTFDGEPWQEVRNDKTGHVASRGFEAGNPMPFASLSHDEMADNQNKLARAEMQQMNAEFAAHFESEDHQAGLEPVKDMTPRPRKPPRGPNETRDSLLEYLARHVKGLDMAEAEEQGIDPADMKLKTAMVGRKSAFRKGGISFDHAAEMLHEAGYPVDDENGHYNPNTLLDLISNELAGDKTYSSGNVQRFKDMEEADYERARQEHVAAAATLLSMEASDQRAAKQAEFAVELRIATDENRRAAIEAWDKAETVAQREAILRQLQETNDAERHESDKAPGASDEAAGAAEKAPIPTDKTGPTSGAEQQTVRGAGERGRGDREPFSLVGNDEVSHDDLVRQALDERPGMEIPDAYGNMVDAAEVDAQATELERQAAAEAEAGFTAAINCLQRGGA